MCSFSLSLSLFFETSSKVQMITSQMIVFMPWQDREKRNDNESQNICCSWFFAVKRLFVPILICRKKKEKELKITLIERNKSNSTVFTQPKSTANKNTEPEKKMRIKFSIITMWLYSFCCLVFPFQHTAGSRFAAKIWMNQTKEITNYKMIGKII